MVPLALTVSLVFWLVPPLILAGALGGVWPGLAAAAAVATALSICFWMLMSAGMRIPLWYGVLYPLGAGVLLYVVARSTWRGSRRVEWRGRTYSGV